MAGVQLARISGGILGGLAAQATNRALGGINYTNTNILECFKGSVQQKLRPRLQYIIQKLFRRRRSAGYYNY